MNTKTINNIILMKQILVLFFILIVSNISAQNKKPNIIYILADDMGYGDVSALNNNSKLNISKTEFHCHCDNLVVIAPFIGSLVYSLPPAFKYFSTFISEKNSELPLFQKIYFELRGPPAFA